MRSAVHLREQARRCRDLADATMDAQAARTLRGMAGQYEEEARLADGAAAEEPPQPRPA